MWPQGKHRNVLRPDQNVMRKPRLADLVESKPAACFVVPDTAFAEMIKSEHWEDTVRRSFAALRTAVDRTFVSLAISEAIRLERENCRAVDRTALLSEEFTAFLRDLIRALSCMRASGYGPRQCAVVA
jgi:hypothetical protein